MAKKPPERTEWESQWRDIRWEVVLKVCKRFWPDATFKSWNDCLSYLSKNRCYANESLQAWIDAGAEDPETLTVDLLRIKPGSLGDQKLGSSARGKEPSSENKEKKTLPSFNSQGLAQMVMATPTQPKEGLVTPDATIPKKQRRVVMEDDEEEIISFSDSVKDTPAPVHGGDRGDQHGEIEKLAKLLQDRGFAVSQKKNLDEGKLAKLSELMPENIALLDPMDKRQKANIFKTVGFFDGITPTALSKDFTSLSRGLSFGQRKKIELLFTIQQRAREKIRFCLQRLYDELDVARPMDEQSEKFHEWEVMLYLILDDMAVAVKAQQKTILDRHGYGSILNKEENSIIPLEYKEQLKELKDFDAAFARKRFFSGKGSSRGRGGFRNFFPSRKGSQSRASRGKQRTKSPRGDFRRYSAGGWRNRNFPARNNNSVSGYASGGAGGMAGGSDDDFFPPKSQSKFTNFSSFRGRPRKGGHIKQ